MNDDVFQHEVFQHGGGIKTMPFIFTMYDTEFFYYHRRHFINLIQYCESAAILRSQQACTLGASVPNLPSQPSHQVGESAK